MSSFLKISLPKEWTVKKLKECVEINPESLNINEIDGNFINYVDISGIDNSTNEIKDAKQVSITNIPSRARRIIKENDVIISTVRPYLKAFSKVKKEHNNFICSTGFAVLRTKQGLDYEYLFQWVLNQKFINYLISQMVGSSYPAVNKSDIEDAPIIIPHLREQQKISSILSNLDDIIVKTQKIIEYLQILKKGLMQRLFTEGIGHTEFKETKWGKIPKNWDISKLKNIGLKFFGGGTPSTENSNYWNGNIPWMTSGNLNEMYIINGMKNITKDGLKNSASNLMPKRSLLISTRVGIGKVGIANIEIAISQDLTGVIIDQQKALTEYIYWVLLNSTNQLINLSQGTTIKGIEREALKNFKLLLPPIQEQNKINTILLNIDDQVNNEKKYLESLKKIKKGLMQDLLTGKKRVKLN